MAYSICYYFLALSVHSLEVCKKEALFDSISSGRDFILSHMHIHGS